MGTSGKYSSCLAVNLVTIEGQERRTATVEDNTLLPDEDSDYFSIIDEASQLTNSKTLLIQTYYIEILLKLIFLGDPKQLPATVKTHG